MSTRLNDQKTGSYIIIQQRVHHNDLLGHVLAKQSAIPWTYLCLPAEFEPDHPNRWIRDPRKEAGELLWPEHVPRAALESIKEALGPYAAAGQLQQRPSPREGGFFKRGWFGFVDVAPSDIRWVRGWDFAATEKQVMKSDPDYTASAKIGYSPSTKLWYVGHIERFREDPDEVERRFIQRAEMDGDQVHVQIPQDPGQAGKGQARNMVRLLPKHSVVAAPVTGDKMSRAHPWAAKAGAGLVKLVKGGWNEPFLVELTSFPTGAHDDQIDAVSAAFERLLSSSSAIVDFYQQQLRDKGIDPATLSISTPLQAAASATSPGDYQAKMAALMAAMKGSG
jgi:predicted phage terminase large subunit-like protein